MPTRKLGEHNIRKLKRTGKGNSHIVKSQSEAGQSASWRTEKTKISF